MRRYTRKGAASIFVVIFTTLLLGIITMSFVRIMISEANQTTNSDLSQSAYDSALAGVEDAKSALLFYHECLNMGATEFSGPEGCPAAVRAMMGTSDEDSTENCDIVSDMLGRPRVEGREETIIQANTENASGDMAAAMEQAYTCVKISEAIDDYRGALGRGEGGGARSKVVPIRMTSTDVDRLGLIRFKWFENKNANNAASGITLGLLPSALRNNNLGYDSDLYDDRGFENVVSAPPTMQVQFIQTDDWFRLSDFDLNRDGYTNQGTLMLRPSGEEGIEGVNFIGNDFAVGLAASNDKSLNNPVDVKCSDDGTAAYWCWVDIVVPKPKSGSVSRNDSTTFLRVALPYGQPDTAFSVELYPDSDDCNPGEVEVGCAQLKFVGVQAKVDATGRANDLFRRVEMRVELNNHTQPYPEFTVDLNPSGEGDNSIWKNFWVTQNNWSSNGGTVNSGPNSGVAGS